MSAEQARRAVVARWRTRRATPRMVNPVLGGPAFEVWEDNAPDWCWQLAMVLEKHTGAEHDFGEAIMLEVLRWCDAGDPEARAKQVRALVENWIGPRVPMLRTFLAYARATRGGRQKKTAAG